MPRSALLACGILSSLVYVFTDIAGALSWDGYDYASQAISELSAIGAPSRPVVLPLFLAYDLLVIAFGFGVRTSAGRALRGSGACLIAIGALGLVATLFPMQPRGAERALTDSMHIALTAATVLCILLAIGFAANALGRGFRRYSIATILTILTFGVLAGLDAPRIDANLPTPFLGITERINVGAYLLWVAVLAVSLLGTGSAAARPSGAAPFRT